MKVNIEFELPNDMEYANFNSCPEALHEALCKAIHEGDVQAHNWLNLNVINIATVEEQQFAAMFETYISADESGDAGWLLVAELLHRLDNDKSLDQCQDAVRKHLDGDAV